MLCACGCGKEIIIPPNSPGAKRKKIYFNNVHGNNHRGRLERAEEAKWRQLIIDAHASEIDTLIAEMDDQIRQARRRTEDPRLKDYPRALYIWARRRTQDPTVEINDLVKQIRREFTYKGITL